MSLQQKSDKKHFDPHSHNARATTLTRFRVFSRVRPFIPTELEEMESKDIRSVVEMIDNKTILLDPKENYAPKAQFEFDDSIWSIPQGYKLRHTYEQGGTAKEFKSQRAVYDMVASGAPEDALNGINTAVLTYGQTGSGKTYTMMGQYDPKQPMGGNGQEGIIPRVCHNVFDIVEAKRNDETRKAIARRNEQENAHGRQQARGEKDAEIVYTVEVTFIEIYMEKVRDLLDPALRRMKNFDDPSNKGHMKEARIRQDPVSGPFVENVTRYRVESWAHCCTLLERGMAHRKTMANAVHQQSSRSHAIFTLNLLQTQTTPGKDKYAESIVRTKVGRINMVDLAGSERGGFTDYVKESSQINKSLLMLRCVIDKLLERQQITLEMMSEELKTGRPAAERTLPTVGFRDSVLTYLLSDSMGGNARTSLVATLSPHEKNYGDTLSTLQWSSRARGLVSVVKVNDAQSSVQSNMLDKIGDLSSTIKFRYASVDALRAELASKEEMALNLERGTSQLKKSTEKADDVTYKYRVQGAATIINLYVRRFLHARRMQKLSDQLYQVRQKIAQAQSRVTASSQQAAEAQHAAANARRAEAEKQHSLEESKRELHGYRAESAAFAQKYLVAQRLNREGEQALRQVEDEMKAEQEQQKKKRVQALSRAAAAEEELQKMNVEMREATDVVSGFSDEERARVTAANEAAEKKVADQEAVCQPLRLELEHLQQRKGAYQKRLEKARR